MSIYRRRFLALVTAFWLVLMLAIWIVLAPTQAGGQATYLVVYGYSMEPDFHFGDLVIVHKDISYQVGDVVAYKNAEVKSYVFHRIIDEKRGRYVLKGDNNSWIDSYEPTHQEVLGKLWAHFPRLGTYLQKLRNPIYMALLAGFIGIMLATTILATKRKGNQSMEKDSKQSNLAIRKWLAGMGQFSLIEKLKDRFGKKREDRSPIPSPEPDRDQNSGQWVSFSETLFFILGLIAFISLMLGILAFTRPATRLVPNDINYQHLGFFAYSATAPAGIYDTPVIRSGDPIFPKLTCFVNVTFNYSLIAERAENVAGTYKLTAFITNQQSGWKRTFALQEETAFTGGAFNTQAEFNLCEIVAVIQSVEQLTELRPGIYTLSITPMVSLNGSISGREFQDTFDPAMTFQYDRTQFYLVQTDAETDPLNHTEDNLVREELEQANILPLFGMELSVPALRIISVIGLGISLSGLLALGLQLQNIARNNQEALVRMKYDPLVIDIDDGRLQNVSRAIDVNSIDDLAKLAEKHNTMILHDVQGSVHKYIVHGEGTSYVHSFNPANIVLPPGSNLRQKKELQAGIDNDEFQVYYQPIISLTDGKIAAVEALLRWNHPTRGFLVAGDFIQMAETTGLIGKLDEWVLQVACAQLKVWQDANTELNLAVNLSDYNLERNPFDLIQKVLHTTGIDPKSLHIEITETKIADQPLQFIPTLQKLGELGIQLALDNFIGQVALSSFDQMPVVTSVKIDRLMTKRVVNPNEALSVQKLIAVATTLGLDVVAKGVETNEEKEKLLQISSHAQGFLLGRPLPAQEIGELIRRQTPRKHSSARKKRSGSGKD